MTNLAELRQVSRRYNDGQDGRKFFKALPSAVANSRGALGTSHQPTITVDEFNKATGLKLILTSKDGQREIPETSDHFLTVGNNGETLIIVPRDDDGNFPNSRGSSHSERNIIQADERLAYIPRS